VQRAAVAGLRVARGAWRVAGLRVARGAWRVARGAWRVARVHIGWTRLTSAQSISLAAVSHCASSREPPPGRSGRYAAVSDSLSLVAQPGPGSRELAGDGTACSSARQKEKSTMLRIYEVLLDVLKQLQPALRRIELKDRDLARQLRRCSSSAALNLAEGMYSRGQNRSARYHSALGSARETLACLEVAVVASYVQPDPGLEDQLDRIVATLVKLVAS
jgi:four helix bundle protein